MKQIFFRILRTERGSWLVTYCSFVLMLLALFIMLTSFSAAEASRVSRFVHSFRRAVSVFTGGVKFERSEEFVPVTPGVMKKDEYIGQLREVIEKLNLEGLVQLSLSDKGLVMTLADGVLFEVGQAELSAQAFPLLHKVGVIIVATGASIRIAGHTDNVPIHTARFSSNWELSTARAVNVLRYFQEVEHVRAERLSAVGYGEFQPTAPNDTPEQRLANRRVEIIFVGEQPDSRGEERVSG
jgi:chemotaxis protein MotB